jgi:crotonobetainyl-CoA:carnitine CoA-transferase CaiB-like acyl-CoA transferase
MDERTPLKHAHRVVDLSQGIAGAYATKVLADAGADVVIVEPPEGSPLRRRSASGAAVDPTVGGVLFQYLACSKRSVVVDLDDATNLKLVRELLRHADSIVWSEESTLCWHLALSVENIRELAPAATVVALSGFGRSGPWAGRPSNDFIWQSLAGSAWNHGSSDDTPLMFGGTLGDFALGTLGALAMLVGKARASRSGPGELIDVSALEVLALTHTMFPITFQDHAKRPYRAKRNSSIPSIHPSSDGWIGFWVTTGQQWLDFCTMIEQFDWLEDPSLGLMDNRALRSDELIEAIERWTSERTTEEIIEFASLLRLPVAPIGNGETLPTFDHFVERQTYVPNPRSGFPQPDVWYRSTGAFRRPFAPSPLLGEHTEEVRAELAAAAPGEREVSGDETLPFEGVRIIDMTAFWAGPIISHPLAMLGADVIHVEAVKRPDGIRMAATIPMSEEGWWETSPFFNGTNTCKRGLTLDLQTETGRDLLKRLVAQADAVIENYSPRVMDQLGLSYDELKAIKPDIIVVRAPAFGITGPWRDRVGYAPTIDQASGLAWVTGEPGGRPLLIGAASDALGGLHGSMALMLALEHRRRTGEGALVESPQVGTALQFSAEQVAEFAANDFLLERIGNRSPVLAPQGVYRTADRAATFPGVGEDDWLAISVEDDTQWRALCSVLGLTGNEEDLDLAGRQREHDHIDATIRAVVRDRDAEALAAELACAGVPACRVVPPHEADRIEPLVASGYFEFVSKQVVGTMRVPRFPLRSSRGPSAWNRRPAPGLGEHNHEILAGLLGLGDDAIEQLAASGVIGNATSVNLGW